MHGLTEVLCCEKKTKTRRVNDALQMDSTPSAFSPGLDHLHAPEARATSRSVSVSFNGWTHARGMSAF